ncbi:M23 family metallopeptidase [Turicibacter bilis]|uniref:M23 family metallopeptidase n=1 Tax=Turicibacter bilis TaxID=2735723 RepID=UPI001BAEFD26|nr:M23 family metallopeptidase [Turicibacter bilis]MBS3198974.1 M23 family metallopeptidase [Turicibacter bilis]
MYDESQQVLSGIQSSVNIARQTKKWLKWFWISVTFIVSNFMVILGVCLALFTCLWIGQFHEAVETEKKLEEQTPSDEEIPPIDGDLIFPMDNFRITCSFTCYSNHGGLDMSGGYGAEIRAVMNGKVIKVVTGYASNGGYLGHPGGYGNQVVIQHENGIQTRYAHMIDSIRVSVGDEVVIGQVIGQQGNSGNSSGSHLHFEWIENGTRIDPMTRLPFVTESNSPSARDK